MKITALEQYMNMQRWLNHHRKMYMLPLIEVISNYSDIHVFFFFCGFDSIEIREISFRILSASTFERWCTEQVIGAKELYRRSKLFPISKESHRQALYYIHKSTLRPGTCISWVNFYVMLTLKMSVHLNGLHILQFLPALHIFI